MTNTTRADIANLIGMLKASFPNYHPNRKTAEVFYRLLVDLPLELLEAAVVACISEPGRAFAPSLGEIRGMAAELKAQAEGLPSAYQAFMEVMDMPHDRERHYAQYRDEDGTWVSEMRQLPFSHPLVEKVAHELGWPRLFPGDNPAVDRAQFIRAYEQELKRDMVTTAQLPAVAAYLAAGSAQLPAGGEYRYEVVRRTSWKVDKQDG